MSFKEILLWSVFLHFGCSWLRKNFDAVILALLIYALVEIFSDYTWLFWIVLIGTIGFSVYRIWYRWLMKKPKMIPPTPEKKWYELHREELNRLEREGKL